MKKSHLFLLIAFLFLIQSCTPEYKIARNLVRSRENISVYFLPPAFVIKSDTRKDIPDTVVIYKTAKDSTLIPNFSITAELSDSIFLESYINSLLGELYELKLNIYSQELTDSFLFRIPTPAYVVNTGQLEVEEFDYIYRDSHEFGEYEYYQELNLKGCNINSWFEISELDKAGKEYKVLFDASGTKDDIFGFFIENIFSGEIYYNYKITPLTTEQFYAHAVTSGIRHAGFIFDYILNENIRRNLPPYMTSRFYFHYDRRTNTIWPVEKEKFQVLE